MQIVSEMCTPIADTQTDRQTHQTTRLYIRFIVVVLQYHGYREKKILSFKVSIDENKERSYALFTFFLNMSF